MKGTVYLVGAGPGDPKLLTVKGQEALRAADVVVYDRLVAPRLLHEAKAGARLIYVGKEAGSHSRSQESINRLLVREAKAGRTVVRLKGGDPFVFGRGSEEAMALAKEKIPYEIVPGVTSAIAVPAYAGIPVTDRRYSSSVAILTGHEDPKKKDSAIRWDRLATACDTLVCLMGVSGLPGIVKQLIAHGRKPSTPCAVIEWGTAPRQRTVTAMLKTIVKETARRAIKPPAVLVVGEVVRLRKQLAWFETKPLFGRRILVTRASDKSAAFADQLEALGADVEQLPAIELAPVHQNGSLKDAVRDLPQTDWVFFTSPEGIGWFSKLLKPLRKDMRSLSGCHIGAIGPKTAATLEAAGLHVDFIPKSYSQEGILHDLPSRVLSGKRALILSAQESRDALESGLRRRGMSVTKVPIYRTVVPKALTEGVAEMFQEPFDYVTVTSASCVDHLAEALRATGNSRLFARLKFASIGPITSKAVREHGGRVAVEARVSTIEGLIDALSSRRRS